MLEVRGARYTALEPKIPWAFDYVSVEPFSRDALVTVRGWICFDLALVEE